MLPPSFNLPSKDSTVVRTLRVTLYELSALLLALLANAEAIDAIRDVYPGVLAILMLFAPVATLVVNLLRKDVRNF